MSSKAKEWNQLSLAEKVNVMDDLSAPSTWQQDNPSDDDDVDDDDDENNTALLPIMQKLHSGPNNSKDVVDKMRILTWMCLTYHA